MILVNLELQCFFCHKPFSDFGPLGAHVRTSHPEIRRLLQRLKITATGQEVVEQSATSTESDNSWEDHGWFQGDDDMALPQPGGGKTPSQRQQRGGRGGSSRPPATVPFLGVEDLSGDPVTAKILGVQSHNTGWNDAIVKIAVNGKSYFLGLKASNPNYEALFNAFGADENKWVGGEFTIGLNWNEFYEKNFVHVFEAPKAGKKGK